MSDTEQKSRIGLDIGTSRIVLARRVQNKFEFQAHLNAFVIIPFSRLTQRVLKKESIPHTVQGQEIIVFGNESEKFADFFHLETRRPMLNGTLNPSEPDNLALVRQIIANLAGPGDRQGHKLCFSIPATPLGSDDGLKYHEAAIRQILGELGYDLRSITEGLAVVYAELESTNYTGIGISCGGGMCNVCLAYLSVPVIAFSILKAGDFVDSSAASVTGEVTTRVRTLKEQSFSFNGKPQDKIHQALAVYYDDLIESLIRAMREAFSTARNLPKLDRPVPLVLSGGSALPQGFRDRFERALQESDFPLAVSEVTLAPDPLYSTAKGALMAALADM